MTQNVERDIRRAGTILDRDRAEPGACVEARVFGPIIAAMALAVTLAAMIGESQLTSDQHIANFERSHTLP
jgi:hypothetical protein